MTYDDDKFDVRPPPTRRFWTSRRLVLPRRSPQGDDPPAEPTDGENLEYTPDPDDFLPSPPKQLGPLNQRPDLSYARPAVMLFVLFFVFSFSHWSQANHKSFAAIRSNILDNHEWWRLLTALFTHADIDHLASNTPLFLIFGWLLHAYFGWIAFPATALLVGVLSNLATIITMSQTGSLVGASGMLYGMVALWLVLYVHFDTDHTVPMRIFRATGVSLLLLFPTTFRPSTSYTAHATGFIIGIAAGMLLTRLVKVRQLDGAQADEHKLV